MAVKNPLKLFEKDRYFLSYDHFFVPHEGAGPTKKGLIETREF